MVKNNLNKIMKAKIGHDRIKIGKREDAKMGECK